MIDATDPRENDADPEAPGAPQTTMTDSPEQLLENNRIWAAQIVEKDPDFFTRLSRQQKPEYLWIGCADSRVPANEIVGLLPGAVFVHRNVANLVVHSDLNCLSVIQFAVDVLKVKHIIICGHYGCGGVLAAMRRDRHGLVDNWLRHVEDVVDKYKDRLAKAADEERSDRLCELNVIEQVMNVSQTTVLEDCWAREQRLTVHGWIYGLHDGRLRDLEVSVSRPEEIEAAYATSLGRYG